MRELLTNIILFLCCMSCVKEPSLNEINYNLFKDWIYAEKVKFFVPTNENVERPPGVEILLFQLNFDNKFHCVYYLVPFKSQLGKITFVENKNVESCPETNQSPEIFLISHVKNVKVSFVNFNLKIFFERKEKQEVWEFPLHNVSDGITHQKFKSPKRISLVPGLTLGKPKEHFIGQANDRFSNRQALRCHQVNAQCETIGEYRCDECRFGWYEVSDYNCPQGGSKFCGQNHCGEKNEPACPRGHKLFQYEETGICQSDLQPVYNSDHILVCQ